MASWVTGKSWIARKAEEAAHRRSAVQLLTDQALGLWSDLKSALRKDVAEFNALYQDDPSRQVEQSEDGDTTIVRRKTQPEVCIEVRLDRGRRQMLYQCLGNQHSTLANEMLIFGDLGGPVQVFTLQVDEHQQPVMARGNERIEVTQASETILAPLLFPE